MLPEEGEIKSEQEAPSLAVYAFVVIFVAVVVLCILALLGPMVGNTFSNIVS